MTDLPPEIIEIIFHEYCPPKTTFPLQIDEPRLIVTQICSQWRAVALATPSLWANIRVSLDSTPLLDPIRAWISRSAQSPLSFGIRIPTNYGTSSTAIVDLIFSVIQRCTSLKLCIDEPTLIRLFSLPPGSLRALQKISIRPLPYVTSLSVIPRATAFQQCPQLRQVAFTFVAHVVDLADFNLSWHQLTHLDMSSCSLREYECLYVLQRCTALQACSISIFPTPFNDLQRIQALSICPVALPSLHALRLDLGDPVDHNVRFFRALRLPRLRSLCAISPTSLPRALLPLFQTLLSETIRHLDLSSWTPTDLPGALALAPNLETLKLWNSDPEVLRTLSGGAVPRLVALSLGRADSHDLFDMLEARVDAARVDNSITVINYVSAVYSGVEGIMASTTRLRALRAAGVQVIFRNWSL